MNSNLELEHARGPQNGAIGSRYISVSQDETRTANGDPPNEPVNWLERRNGKRKELRPASIPAPSRVAIEPTYEPTTDGSNARRRVFRCVRLTLAGALVTYAIAYTRTALTTVRSEEAYINGEITALRAPIAGEVRRHAFTPGTLLPNGTLFFTVENPRYGNEQALSQLNFVTELAQRLRAEAQEATVRFAQQEHRTQLHEKMYGEQIIPRLELLEEQTKLQVAGTVMTNKLTLAKKAEERVAELNTQVELQQAASVSMPFEGVVWSSPVKDGAQVAAHETVAEVINPSRIWVDAAFHERHAGRLGVGCAVNIQTKDGQSVARGMVESVRGGGGRTPSDGVATFSPGVNGHRRIAARIKLESENRFGASEFLGVARGVTVTLECR